MTRKRRARRRAPRFMLEDLGHSTRDARSAMGLALVLTCLVGVFGALAGARLGLAFSRRTKGNACASGLGEADSDSLFWRPGAVLATTDFADLLMHELARLGCGRLALALVLAC